uniref:Integrase catalytic domain-containing protein n=2 Tax=Strongyloides venezuelensis TaxID=75913 RepID=A0A0K0FHQ9_STRVS
MSLTERNYAIIEKEMTIVGEHLKNTQKIICAYDCEFVTTFKATEHFIKFGLEYSSKNVYNVSARIQRLIVPFISAGVSVTCKPKKITQFCNSAVLEKARMPASLTPLNEWIPHENIFSFQSKDALCLQLKRFLRDELKNVEKLPHYLRTRLAEIGFENGLICVNSCPLVSHELAARLCFLIHEHDHKAETALYNTVINLVYTNVLSKIASSTVQNCQLCLKCRRNPVMHSIKWSKATFPRERGHFDCGYFNSKCFIVLIDSYSGYTFGRFLKDKSLEQLISFFDSVMVDQMPFKIIVSDNEPSLCSQGLSEYLKSTGTFYWGKSYERLNSPVYCPTANGLAEKIVGIVKTKFKHLTSKAIPFSKLMSYALREINHQFRRSGETPAAKFYGMTAHLKVYKEPLGLPEPTDPTPIYFKKSRKEQEFMLGTLVAKLGHRILMIQDCFGDVHAVSKDFTHSQGKECYTLKDTFMTADEPLPKVEDLDDSSLDNLLDISVETAVPGEDVGYTSDPDEAGFLSQFEAVFDHDDGLSNLKNEDVADDKLTLMKILEKELQSPETDTIAFIDGSSYSGGGYGILLYHRNDLDKNFAMETISERNIKCGAAKPTGGRMEILALQKILEIAATRKFKRTVIFTDYKNAVGALKLNWIAHWDEKNYVGIKHPYLWKSIHDLSRQVKFVVYKIKAHANIAPQETADQLAKGFLPKNIPDFNNYFKKGSE